MLRRSWLKSWSSIARHSTRRTRRPSVRRRPNTTSPYAETLEDRTLLAQTFLPGVEASIQDQPRDGFPDSVVTSPFSNLVTNVSTREDRAIVEFDLSTLSEAVNLAVLDFGLAVNSQGTPVRPFDIYLYSADGIASLSDFSAAGTQLDTVTLLGSEGGDNYRLDVTNALQNMLDGGATWVGLRVEAHEDVTPTHLNDPVLTINDAPAYTGLRGWETTPNVIRTDGVDSFHVEVDVGGAVKSVTLDPFSPYLVPPNAGDVVLRDDGLGGDRVAGDFIYTSGPFRYNTSRTLPEFYQNDPNSPAGVDIQNVGSVFIEELDGAAPLTEFLLDPAIGLLRADIPAAPTTALTSDIVASSHVINVQTNLHATQRSARTFRNNLNMVTQKVYEVFPDAFDFLMMFSTNKVENANRFARENFTAGQHFRARTNYTGTGFPESDNTAFYGSDGRLLSVNFLDAFDRGMYAANATHELMHQWAAFLDPTLGISSGAHYNPRSSVGSMVGGFQWIDNNDGTYTINFDEGANSGVHASPLDLYLMGLIDKSEVPPIMAYDDAIPLKRRDNPIVTADEITTVVTIDDIIARHGLRTPGPAAAQKDFQIGFVAESHNRLLTATEMTFYTIFAEHYTKPIPAGTPDPRVYFGWQSIDRYFGHGTTWSSALPEPLGGNEPPTVNDQIFTVTENSGNGTAVGLVTATDPDLGQNLTYAIIGGNTGNAFSINADTGQIAVADSNQLNFESTPVITLTVEVTDDAAVPLSDTATITISILDVNEAPVADDQTFTIDEDDFIVAQAATDEDGDPLSFTITTPAANGRVFFAPDGRFQYSPNFNFHGTDSFTFTVSDGALTDTATITVNVTSINDPPFAALHEISTDEDTAVSGQAGALEVESDPVTFSLEVPPEHGSVVFNPDGTYTYTPNPDFHGSDGFAFRATDDKDASTIGGVLIEVLPVNDAPVAGDDGYSVNEDETLTISVAPVSRLVMISEEGEFVGQGQSYDYTSANATFRATQNFDDGVSILVAPPGFTDPWNLDFAAPFGELLVEGEYLNAMRWPFQDFDRPGLSISGDHRGPNTVVGEFTVFDATWNAGETEILSFAAAFRQQTDGDEPAIFGTIQYNTTYGAGGGVLDNDTDVDEDFLTALLVSGPSNGALTLNPDGSLSYTPNPNFHGADSFTYKAHDGALDSQTATVTITVNSVNDAPVIDDQTFAVSDASPDGTPVGTVAATDVDAGQSLTFAITGGNTGNAFAIDPATGTITVADSTQLDFSTIPTYSLTVEVTDNGSPQLSDTAIVTVDLQPTGEIRGVKWHDLDGDGVRDDGEPGLEGWTIFLDENRNRVLDPGETSTTTGPDGSYAFTGLMPGSYPVAEVAQPGWEPTSPNNQLAQNTQIFVSGGNQVVRIGVDGSNPTTVLTGVRDSIGIDEVNGHIYFMDSTVPGATNYRADLGTFTRELFLDAWFAGTYEIDPQHNRLFFPNGRHVYVADLDNPQPSQVNAGLNSVVDVQYDPVDDLIYVANGNALITGENIWTFSPSTGAGTRIIGGSEWSDLGGLAVDSVNRKLYFTENGVIYSANLDGSDARVFIDTKRLFGQARATDLQVVPELNAIFWVDEGAPGVYTASLNGSGARRILDLDDTEQLGVFVPFFTADVTAGGVTEGVNFGNRRVEFDFGDAPDATQSGFLRSYPTALSQNGARHVAVGPTLGPNRDAEADGAPSANADGDDATGASDDEDGVVFSATLVASTLSSTAGSVQVDLQNADAASNILNGWIDWNGDGDWRDFGEHILSDVSLGTANGVQTLHFAIPQDVGNNVAPGDTFARFRLSTAEGIAPIGAAADGEVEDVKVTVRSITPTVAFTSDFQMFDEGIGTVFVTAQLSEAIGADVTVPFTVSGDATPGATQDFTIDSSPITIPAGATSATIAITINDDVETETDESIVVTLGTPVNANLGAVTEHTAMILDNDPASPNLRPTVNDDAFTVDENSAAGTLVGTVTASDPDEGQLLTYAITAGNTDGAFAIDPSTGAITVANSGALDFEAISSFGLTVAVTDNGSPRLSDSATITVRLLDVNEAPVVTDQSFTVAENSADGTPVGAVAAVDPDAGQSLTYTITAGNSTGAFTIDPATGAITVANGAVLDFEATSAFSLTVEVSDNGTPVLSDAATITIELTDVNEAPSLADAAFSIPENSVNGTAVGIVSASDPDAGQSLTYAITAGNTDGAFAINGSTGAITVANSGALDFESTSVFTLTVEVSDNGTPTLSDAATITIDLTDVNEAPIVADQTFSVPENSSTSTAVGTVVANDPDAGQSSSYSLIGGNTGNAFVINPGTGEITVDNSAALDFETTPTFTLTVQVTDNGTPSLSDTATVTIDLTDVNEAPSLADQAFSIAENSGSDASVGTILATDGDAGQSLSFAFLSGNLGGAFAIDATTGEVTVANPSQLDFETTPVFTLTVQITDNGTPELSDAATITIELTDVNEAPSLADAAFSIPENSPSGAAVGTITGTDPDAGQSLAYAITAGNTDGAFTIDAATGAITVANSRALDFETTPVFTLTVQVTDGGTPTLSDTATITVRLTDGNERPTIVDQEFSVPENSGFGTAVGTVAAGNPDAGQTVTFAIIDGNAAGGFAIHPATGAITVADGGPLDFETTPVFTLTVEVTDNGTPALSESVQVTIRLLDANDSPDVEDQTFSVAENSPDGIALGTVTASDADAGQTLSFAIADGNASGIFAIDAATGAIHVVHGSQLDFEAQSTYTLTVDVTDNGVPALSDTATVTILVTDVNEAPTANDALFSLTENSVNGTAVGTVSASDPDGGQSLSYAITDGNPAGAFAIDSTTGAITVANSEALNFEATPVFMLTVEVTDSGNPALFDTAMITIELTDANEAPAVADQSFTVDENSANGTPVGAVVATDSDAGQTLSFAILAGNLGGAFAIDSSTGAITVADGGALDFEAASTFTLTVEVTDNGTPTLSATAAITIQLTDVNEAPTAADATFSVVENRGNGTAVGTVTASDPDGGQSLAYAITGGNTDGAFAIDGSTGAITVADSGALNYEAATTFTLTVEVTDNGAPALSDTAAITIHLSDVNEAPTVEDQTFSVNENSADGTSVGTVVAGDPDAGQTLTYAFVSGNESGAFAVDSATGEITVADGALLDFATMPTFTLTVQVTDNGSPSLSNTATITIQVRDVTETDGPTIDIRPGEDVNVININSRGNVWVAILSTADFDAPEEVDPDSLTFGRTGDEDSLFRRGRRGKPKVRTEDVNGDGLADLLAQFHIERTGFRRHDTEGLLKGQTVDGTEFEARDSVVILSPGKEKGRRKPNVNCEIGKGEKSRRDKDDHHRHGRDQDDRGKHGYGKDDSSRHHHRRGDESDFAFSNESKVSKHALDDSLIGAFDSELLNAIFSRFPTAPLNDRWWF